jgi:virulence-associated protein VapD
MTKKMFYLLKAWFLLNINMKWGASNGVGNADNNLNLSHLIASDMYETMSISGIIFCLQSLIYKHIYTIMYEEEKMYIYHEDRDRIIKQLKMVKSNFTNATKIATATKKYIRIYRQLCYLDQYTFYQKNGHLYIQIDGKEAIFTIIEFDYTEKKIINFDKAVKNTKLIYPNIQHI